MEITSLCKDCENKACPSLRTRKGVVACSGYIAPQKPMTNADRIRAMSDEELAAWIASMTTVCECCAELNECEAPKGFNRCVYGVVDWLQQPAEEDSDG